MSLILDPRTTALVLIDLQNGILAIPLAPHSAAQILANATTLARRLTELGGTVVLVHVAFADNYADRPNQPVDQPMQAPPGGLPAGWSEFSPDIGALHADVIITKRQWSAFHGTELDLQLRRRGIDTILLGGVATNFGVEFHRAGSLAAQLRGGRRRRRVDQHRRRASPLLGGDDPAAGLARALDGGDPDSVAFSLISRVRRTRRVHADGARLPIPLWPQDQVLSNRALSKETAPARGAS